jgi:hypothetical protein
MARFVLTLVKVNGGLIRRPYDRRAMNVLIADARAEIERFIAERFLKAYGAQVSHFCAHLLGARSAAGAWQAAAGYTPAGSGALYLEHYLDRPVEAALAALTGRRVPRAGIVEVGNLVAASAGCGRSFLPALGQHLAALEHRWVVFTATREVRNLLRRLAFPVHVLAPALPERLPDRGAAWGSYYAHDPNVMAGCLP